MQKKEIWKDVPGYEGYYQASSLGRIKSFDRKVFNGKSFFIKKGRMFKLGGDNKKYPQANLCINGNQSIFRVHKLVALAFIPNPDNKKEVDHIDGNPRNNHVKNLKWVTHLENMNNPIAKERISKAMKGKCAGDKNHWYGKHGKDFHSSKPVLQFSVDGKFIKKHENPREASKEIGCHYTSIYRVCNKIPGRLTAGGFLWEYEII